MMKFIIIFLSLIMTQLTYALNKPIIITSFSIIQDIVKNIAGDKFDVLSIVGDNEDVHDYELKPSDVKKINNSKIFFINGLGLEGGFISQALNNYKGNKVVLTEDIPKFVLMHSKKIDPHVWQDITLVKKYYLPKITNSLIKFDPNLKDYLKQNELKYIQLLDTLDKWAINQFNLIDMKKRNAITTHDAFSYFARHYNLNFVTVQGVSTDSEATPYDVAKLQNIIKKKKIKYVFLENMTNNKLIKQIAADTNVLVGPHLYSDALSNKNESASTYIEMFRYNVTTLVNTWK
jgi:zinc/manganese transport system substrate-binding protein